MPQTPGAVQGLRLLRILPETIRGYFDLSRLPKGGTRPTYAQQKLYAVLEAITPATAVAER